MIDVDAITGVGTAACVLGSCAVLHVFRAPGFVVLLGWALTAALALAVLSPEEDE